VGLKRSVSNSPNNWVDVTGANSASEDNNYELIEFVVENTGTYRVVTEKVSVQNTDNGNYVGTALLKLPYGAGDVNCDGMVSTVDALYIIQSDIGTRPFDSTGTCANYPSTNPTLITACDVSKASSSTPCDTSDALFILQCDVGISNALCPTNRDNYSIYIPDF